MKVGECHLARSDAERIHLLEIARSQPVITRLDGVAGAAFAGHAAARTLARYTALILNDSILQRRGREILLRAYLQRVPLPLIMKEEEQTVLQNRPADGSTEDVPYQVFRHVRIAGLQLGQF